MYQDTNMNMAMPAVMPSDTQSMQQRMEQAQQNAIGIGGLSDAMVRSRFGKNSGQSGSLPGFASNFMANIGNLQGTAQPNQENLSQEALRNRAYFT